MIDTVYILFNAPLGPIRLVGVFTSREKAETAMITTGGHPWIDEVRLR